MPDNVAKAYAINDAKIMFVSLVDKAANQKQFLITKAENGTADFQTYGRIIKTDDSAHFVTGIVYEPMVEDSQGNYMTEKEITKAAHWFMKNQGDVDLQHSFQPLDGATVVESNVAKCDEEINGQTVRKGTWLMTMEITNPDVYEAIAKGDITGFSMGGTGVYSDEDVTLPEPDETVEKSKGRGILKQLAAWFGMDTVEKGAVKDNYERRIIRDNFWTAYSSLSDCLLDSYNPSTGHWEPQTDETVIREALSDFNEIVSQLLRGSGSIIKALEVGEDEIEKSGKAMSTANRDTLRGIHESLGAFLSKFDEQEDEEVTKAEVETMIAEAITKAMSTQNAAPAGSATPVDETEGGEVTKAAEGATEPTEGITAESIQKMVDEAIQKAMQPIEKQLSTQEEVQAAIEEAVAKAMEPVLKSTGLPTNLNNEGKVIEKQEEHYLHGIL